MSSRKESMNSTYVFQNMKIIIKCRQMNLKTLYKMGVFFFRKIHIITKLIQLETENCSSPQVIEEWN